MQIEVSKRSLESTLNMITSFYRTEKMDNPDSVLIKGSELTGAVIGVETQLSSLACPLLISPIHPITGPFSFPISIKDLTMVLSMLEPDSLYINFEINGSVITVSDQYSSHKIVVATDLTPDVKLGQGATVVLRSNLKTLSYLFKKALNLLPVPAPEQDALYICKTPDEVLAIVADYSKALLISTNSISMETDVVRIPSRVLMVINTLSSLDKVDLPIVILQSSKDGANYIEVRMLNHNFHFGMIDRGGMDEIIKNARTISFDLPQHITLDREQAIQTIGQLHRITAKDLEPFITIEATGLGLLITASPRSVEGEFTKKLPSLESSFDLEDRIKLLVNPKYLLDSLRCFSGPQVTLNFSDKDKDPIGLSSDTEESIQLFVAKVKF